MKAFLAYPVAEREFAAELDRALRREGCDVLGPFGFGSEVLSEISAAIRTADVVIAVVTASNPNVFYELGLAVGANVPALIAARVGDSLPADVTSVPYVQLTDDAVRDTHEIVRRATKLANPPRVQTPDLGSAHATLSAAAREPGLLESLSPVAFEDLVRRLFVEQGFDVTAPASRVDRGADFTVESDGGVVVEVKKRSRQSRVSVETVGRLLGVIGVVGASRGMIISSSGFTAAAQALAEQTSIALFTLEELLASVSRSDLLGPR